MDGSLRLRGKINLDLVASSHSRIRLNSTGQRTAWAFVSTSGVRAKSLGLPVTSKQNCNPHEGLGLTTAKQPQWLVVPISIAATLPSWWSWNLHLSFQTNSHDASAQVISLSKLRWPAQFWPPPTFADNIWVHMFCR
jgi:hypothetical protein